MTKREKTILRLEQIVHHLETNGKYLEDRFLQEAVEDIKSSVDLLEMVFKDLRAIRDCCTCKFGGEPIPPICKGCSHSRVFLPDWQWRGDAEC